ncbi:MAG: hypothetical protein JWN04_1876 [Myxococcaceae bacterium]|nr:hypothetical protein [Myxococcaceae bacterium]
MTHLTTSALLFAALPLLLATGCSSSDKTSTGKSAATAGCDDGDNKTGDDCTCDDGSAGAYACSDDALACLCDGDSTPKADAGGKKPKTPAKDGGAATTKSDAKVQTGTPAPIADAGHDNGDPGTVPPVSTTGPSPVLPMATGPCPEFKSGTTTIGGLANITLYVGPKSNGTGPLLFYWHGTAPSNASEVNLLPAAMRQDIMNQGGIIVVPQDSTKKGSDCSGTGTFYQGDFERADLIAACAVKNYGIDPRRIYTTGCSAGGLQAGCMASLRSNYIAAAVTNSGGSVYPQKIENMSHIPALMTMHGDKQDMVIVYFSDTSKAQDDQFAAAGGFVIDCDHAGGHCGAPADLQTAGWKFMQDHPYGAAPEPYASGVPATFPSYCKVISK